MPSAYRIKNWNQVFENSESRKLKNLNWVPLPNSWEGLGYARVTKHKNAVTIMAAWPLVIQIGSKCPQRGLLAKVDAPLSVEDMADLTRMPAQIFDRALEALVDPLIGWVEIVQIEKGENGVWEINLQSKSQNLPQSPDTSGSSGLEQNRTEQKGMEQKEGMSIDIDSSSRSEDVVKLWNSQPSLPSIRDLTSDRRRALKTRLSEPFFRDNFVEGIQRIAASSFCTGNNEREWTATFDWFLKPGSITKILEGKYDGKKKSESSSRFAAMLTPAQE